MRYKKASLVINPRTGQNVAKLNDVLAILYAAGWKTKLALKEYGCQAIELANQAVEDKNDLVIAYGGDGTLNQVVNGVMKAKGHKSVVGVIPGGTANVWAGEIGVPVDPVKAALSLVNSEPRKVDVGYVEVVDVTFPQQEQQEQEQRVHSKKRAKEKTKSIQRSAKVRQYFLLMAGLGVDAAIMSNVSKPLKYRIGPIAIGLSAAKELPTYRPFPVEIRSSLHTDDVMWRGEAVQLVIGNTRRYADVAELTPMAYIDDGVLDVCVVTSGSPLTTMQQISSLLLRRKLDNVTAEYFHGAQLYIRVPATVPMQFEGSPVRLKDYLASEDYERLQQTQDQESVMVTYCFEAVPRALEIAIPCTYNDELFERSHSAEAEEQRPILQERESSDSPEKAEKSAKEVHHHKGDEPTETGLQLRTTAEEAMPRSEVHREERERKDEQSKDEKEDSGTALPRDADALLQSGRKVTVVGKAPLAGKKDTYIVAGGVTKQSTGETRPVAVVINGETKLLDRTGKRVTLEALQELQEGTEFLVDGKKSKRGVIHAECVVL